MRWASTLFLTCVLSTVVTSQHYAPAMAPFFFLCAYQNKPRGQADVQDVALSISLAGDPQSYVPGQTYKVTIESTKEFDGFLLTGLYSSSASLQPPSLSLLSTMRGDAPSMGSSMCSVIHSYMSHQQKTRLLFDWLAPRQGTGCISFLATATMGDQILFKDTSVMHICEHGSSQAELRPSLADIHQDGVILRDDFDSTDVFDKRIWINHEGFNVSEKCGLIGYGKAAVACNDDTTRNLVTVPLKLTAAKVVQFTLSSGTCKKLKETEYITLSYSKDKTNTWKTIQQVQLLRHKGTYTQVVHLPRDARHSTVNLKWQQQLATNATSFSGCAAMDNVLVVNVKDPPIRLRDTFDPIDPSNWLFFPGAFIKHKCHSDSNAMVFENRQNDHNYVTTIDLDLRQSHEAMLSENFQQDTLEGWVIKGSGSGTDCGVIDEGRALVFSANEKARLVCIPYMDMANAGNLRFYYTADYKSCHSKRGTKQADVFVFADDEHGHSVTLHVLKTADKHKEARHISVPIPVQARSPWSRVCWVQKSHGGEQHDVWAIDTIQILPVLPAKVINFMQFELNMHCGSDGKNSSVTLEFSVDHGSHWYPLHEPCLPGSCKGQTHTLDSTYKGSHVASWQRMTVPVPSAALSKHTRFRWRQLTAMTTSSWTIDNVYIGACSAGCSDHGYCVQDACRCDSGFEGTVCSDSKQPLPSMLVEDMLSVESVKASFSLVRGHSLGYVCGVVASEKALVFNQDGPREIQTNDLNTTLVRYLQFSIRVGSESETGECPPPDHGDELVLLQYLCAGSESNMWHVLQQLQPSKYTDPQMVSVHLPSSASKPVCRFRWSQPAHSGHSRDVWALDDVSLTSHMYNTISLHFDNAEETTQALHVHLGRLDGFCGRKNTLSFVEPYQEGESRYLLTDAMHVGPSYVIQFYLRMGCRQPYAPHLDNHLRLEYSVDHGMTWALVHAGCWPPKMCSEHRTASVFHATEFENWRRVAIALPPNTWSSSSRFQLRQAHWTERDGWAIADLYIGQQCPDMCTGHGTCVDGICECDKGFWGTSCTPEEQLPSSLKTDFSRMSKLHSDWSAILGGEVAGSNQGCGIMLSGESMYFSKDGPRQLVTRDLYTLDIDYVQFYIRVAGGNNVNCYGIERREENILVQYSNDGGIMWHLLKELQETDYNSPRFVHIELPEDAQTECSRFRWWQPTHSGPNVDQWALDEITFTKYAHMDHFQDNFQQPAQIDSGDIWLTITEGMYARYCQSPDDTLMFVDQHNDKFAMTKDLQLKSGDIIQFKINVGCSRVFSYHHPVLFQYSHDAGMSWSLVERPCYIDDQCDGRYSEGSVYYVGTYGEWRLVLMHIPDDVINGRVNFRWWQKGGAMSSFALDDVYIGRPCPEMCNGHGICVQGQCECDVGYEGAHCLTSKFEPHGMIDRFDNMNRPSALWERILGGQLGTGCGVIGGGNTLYFAGSGSREARTVPLNTTNIRMTQFTVQLGSADDRPGCAKAKSRNEGVIVDFSTDNGFTWHVLRVLDPESLNGRPQVVTLELPHRAKAATTVIRWWQPIVTPGTSRAEWAIDDVIIAVNDTSSARLQENFNPMKQDIWYMAMNAIPKITCSSRDNALEFSKNGGAMRYAETWDYQVTPSTFLQFDIAMGCSGTFSTLYAVKLQYSVDMGHTWHYLADQCLPPQLDCNGYHLSSSFMSDAHANWTRVTRYLPPAAVSRATRFRWLQETVTQRGNVWALDNIYLGDGCPWMCSGHGHCNDGICVCDPGYFGMYCVPAIPLPIALKDNFDTALSRTQWPEFYGGEISNICGILVSQTALTFYKDNLRMVVSQDLDISLATFLQFTFQYGCDDSLSDWPREHTVLLQYSSNGGIVWRLLKEMHFQSYAKPRFFSIEIPTFARTNATRVRFWQPEHDGHMNSIWAIDNFFANGATMNPDMLYETFGTEPNSDFWIFWPGGRIAKFCSFNTRSDTILAGSSSMVFSRGPGEHSITTRDLAITEMTILQFDINVGCTALSTHDFPVQLAYSKDQGKSWHLLVPACSQETLPICADRLLDSTVYYSGTTENWRRVIIPLAALHVCGTARFRWYQGTFTAHDQTPEWAIDNVYIGVQCQGHCSGHGSCINGMLCQCDEGYDTDVCTPSGNLPKHLKEDFEVTSKTWDIRKWSVVSGASRSKNCGQLLNAHSLHFAGTGERMLLTQDMDLSVARIIEFFIRLGCDDSRTPNVSTQPVLLQFSVDGGIMWHTVEQFAFSKHSVTPKYIAIHVPQKARTRSTRLRWWQPSTDGTYREQWAIDQVYIGGDINGRMILEDSDHTLDADIWVMHPSGSAQPACGSPGNALHFSGKSTIRYAVTTDVTVTMATYLQFYISMGCKKTDKCYGVDLQYSLDFGQSWKMLRQQCLLSDVDCTSYYKSSTFMSDLYHEWTRVNILLPYYTRSTATRFRWIQQQTSSDRDFSDDTWALMWLYIGDECEMACSGHGRCFSGNCLCDAGWIGVACAETKKQLPTLISDSFSEKPDSSLWLTINGGDVSKQCGVLSSGAALYFSGSCTRQLISVDLDLREAIFIQFHFKFGCTEAPTYRDEGILIHFSIDGGIHWQQIVELLYDQYSNSSFKLIALPDGAKIDGVRLRFWQMTHTGGERAADWAVDNILVAGKAANPAAMKDDFHKGGIRRYMWFEDDNARLGAFCGSSATISGAAESNEDVVLTTADMAIQPLYILQFSLSVGCNTSDVDSIAPVTLQYSTSYGMHWEYVVRECLTFYPECNGDMTPPSVFFASSRWRRITIKLKGATRSKATRFRWYQTQTSQSMDVDSQQQWALDDVYIGPACKDLCNGHGQCDYPVCICDIGYTGENCHQVTAIKTYLKDTFSEAYINEVNWSLVQGGSIAPGCTTLVEGAGLHFKGKGQRQATTVDLDLRNARFIQYYAMIGGPSTKTECGTPTERRDSVILQYSTDAGIVWHTLHILDFSSYRTHPQRDYIPLPRAARTNSTRVRWWQSFTGDRHIGWTLDDVYIGGHEINPSELRDTFDESLVGKWDSMPNGHIEGSVCERPGRVLYWKGGAGVLKAATTEQLIVQSGYMLQFKIMVGCQYDSIPRCATRHQSVHLQYNKEPLSSDWQLVYPECLLHPDSSHHGECHSYPYSAGSVYSAASHALWTRVSLRLPSKVFSSTTQFRWIQQKTDTEAPDWAIDDVYIGEACPEFCNGRGDCVHGKCVCDPTYTGPTCEPNKAQLASHMTDGFEGGISAQFWERVSGGGLGLGCGSLLPYAHGKTLYFNGCGIRQALTAEMELSKSSKVMFVLQIGSKQQTAACNVQQQTRVENSSHVLLQYTTNKGVDWYLIANHEPHEFTSPKRVAYDMPNKARTAGVQLRWWQPKHRGVGKDQWAIDYVEIVTTRQDQMMHTESRYRKRYRSTGFSSSRFS